MQRQASRGHGLPDPAIRSEKIQRSFAQAVNRIIDNKAEIIHTCEAVLDERCDEEGLAAEYASL